MKKAVITVAGKQHVVYEGLRLAVDHLVDGSEVVTFPALLTVEGDKVEIGKPELKNVKVTATVLEKDAKDEKVTAIRFKAKKRVKKVRGHRQVKTVVRIDSIK